MAVYVYGMIEAGSAVLESKKLVGEIRQKWFNQNIHPSSGHIYSLSFQYITNTFTKIAVGVSSR